MLTRSTVPGLALTLAVAVWPAARPAVPQDLPPVDDFLTATQQRLHELSTQAGRAAWVQRNFITEDTNILAAEAGRVLTDFVVQAAQEAARYSGEELTPEQDRKLKLLRLALSAPAPADPAKSAELAGIKADLLALYGSGQWCPNGAGSAECEDLEALEEVMDHSRDPAELLRAWEGWRTISLPMRAKYERFVELTNEGARELGFADNGAMWRAGYDMDPDTFAAELERLWEQVRPLYEALHCHVRARLNGVYGDAVVPLQGLIPAHLLGNMWAQSWSNIYDLVAPPEGVPAFALTQLLEEHGYDAIRMMKTGEAFFTSLGFAPLPDTFWERSLFTKPQDRQVVCHPSAWDIDDDNDLRIKMCTEVNAEDFETIHHELGHNFYQRAYNQLPYLYRSGANDGFHEAVGDTIALSVTPGYLVQIGLLDAEPDPSSDLGLLLRRALDKVAFLPFGLFIDQWRWGVFSGQIPPDQYEQAWWQLREKYQGIAPPVPRTEADFDPGAKYHIPANTPYTRYFLAHILQFQFQRALCEKAGYHGPLHRCSIYGDQAAGQALREMLAMGQSRPWPDALEALTGQRTMDATAVLDYFAPLKSWLDEQNAGRRCGW